MQTATSDQSVVNIAAYCFAQLAQLQDLRARLRARCRELGLRGTILLSPEGINLFIAGDAAAVADLLALLRGIAGLEGLAAKYSHTDTQPFRRMLVRIKKEIIAFGVPGIEPARYTSPRIQPAELRRWFDEGRRFTLLDTRNDYEVKLGTFRGAVPARVDHFRDFPAAVAKLPEAMKSQPVVTFCTGGIRCEKAAPYMESQGFGEVYQLDGGILRYFEECGGAHYDGDCFVFDQRVGLDPGLHETSAAVCYACLAPLTPEEQSDERYVAGQSCPYCYRSPAEQQAQRLAARQAALQALAHPLPGSSVRENLRPMSVPRRADGMQLRDALAIVAPHLSAQFWDEQCAGGNILGREGEAVAAGRIVRAGERYRHRSPAQMEPDVSADVRLLYEDEAIVVLDKPAPLPMHPAGRYNRNTLQFLLESLYHPQKPRPAHRLDANTTGVVVVARTRHCAGQLQPQFEAGTVGKRYLVRVQGHPGQDQFNCDAPVRAEAGDGGLRLVDAAGQPALTRFRILQRCEDGTSLLEAMPVTGRTNQIRLHCTHLGLPIVGDRVYGAAQDVRVPQTFLPGEAPLCLHAWEIRFCHPISGDELRFAAPAPEWAGPLAGRLP